MSKKNYEAPKISLHGDLKAKTQKKGPSKVDSHTGSGSRIE